MRSTTKEPSSPESVDRRMLLLLKRKGAQTIEDLTGLAGVGWQQVFFSVDRLSRAGKVSLTLTRPCEYRVSVAQSAR